MVRNPNNHQSASPWPVTTPKTSKLRPMSGCPVGSSPSQVIVENSVQDTNSTMPRMLTILPVDSSADPRPHSFVSQQPSKKAAPWAGILASGNGLDVATMVSTPTASAIPTSGPQAICGASNSAINV
jgi:hypothetical protein